MGEQALRLQIGQRAGFADLPNGSIISRERLAHKTDAAHAGVALDMNFADTTVFGTLRGKRLGVFKRKNRLRNIVLRKPLRVTNGCVTQNEDRQLDAGRADLDALVDIADRKKVRAEPFIYIGKLRRAVTVAVRLDDAAQLGGVADLFFDFQKIMRDGVE